MYMYITHEYAWYFVHCLGIIIIYLWYTSIGTQLYNAKYIIPLRRIIINIHGIHNNL